MPVNIATNAKDQSRSEATFHFLYVYDKRRLTWLLSPLACLASIFTVVGWGDEGLTCWPSYLCLKLKPVSNFLQEHRYWMILQSLGKNSITAFFFFSPFSATMISCIPHLIHDSGMLKVRELLKPQKMEYGSGVRSSIESTRWHIETTQSRVRSVLTPGGVNSCLSRGCESAL